MKKSVEAAEHPILLESSAQLSEAKKSWFGNGFLGIDTEFVRERTYRADLGLVQVSDGRTAWLIDPLQLDTLDTLRELLEEPGITKILHSGSEDLEVLSHTVGAPPSPLIDTQIACAMLGQPLQMGYHATVQWLFDIEVDKEQTRSNWCRRPLTERQLHYAAMDVVLLPAIAATLLPRLEEKGRRAWMEEDVALALRNARKTVRPENAYLRISGAGRLDAGALRTLRALAAWRETTAQQKNLARGFIISDAGLLNLARSRPASRRAARELEGIHPKALERYWRTLAGVMESAAEDDSPVRVPRPLDNAQRKQINAMRNVVQEKAEQLDVEPALLASRRELENLLRSILEDRALPERFGGWRKDVITDDLLDLFG